MKLNILQLKKALGVKWAVEALWYYLLGSPFQLITDHTFLRCINSTKDTNARVTRWYLSLQPYEFQVLHHLGRAHANADFS